MEQVLVHVTACTFICEMTVTEVQIYRPLRFRFCFVLIYILSDYSVVDIFTV